MLVNQVETMRGDMSHDWPTEAFKHLVSGRDYVVIQAFKDFDQGQHPVGERWTYIGSSFLPYDDGLSLFMEVDGKRRQVRMQWRDEEQGPIIDRLQDYVRAA